METTRGKEWGWVGVGRQMSFPGLARLMMCQTFSGNSCYSRMKSPRLHIFHGDLGPILTSVSLERLDGTLWKIKFLQSKRFKGWL